MGVVVVFVVLVVVVAVVVVGAVAVVVLVVGLVVVLAARAVHRQCRTYLEPVRCWLAIAFFPRLSIAGRVASTFSNCLLNISLFWPSVPHVASAKGICLPEVRISCHIDGSC